jgi:hypothetical protein
MNRGDAGSYRPSGDGLRTRVREVVASWARAIRSWEIWVHLGLQDIKNRYKRSLVGPLWIAISLAVMVVGMSFLFGRLFSQEGGRYVVYLTIGMMLWSLISSSITDGGYAFLSAESYIRQIPQAKQVLTGDDAQVGDAGHGQPDQVPGDVDGRFAEVFGDPGLLAG